MAVPRVSNADGGAACVVKQDKKQRGGVTGKGFMPGKSGNPNGRPHVEDTLKDVLRAYGNLKLPAKLPPAWSAGITSWRLAGFPEPTTLVQLDAAMSWSRSLDGDAEENRQRRDRMYGKPVQAISGPDGGAIQVSFAALVADKAGE
jgi:hypothetical protein